MMEHEMTMKIIKINFKKVPKKIIVVADLMKFKLCPIKIKNNKQIYLYGYTQYCLKY